MLLTGQQLEITKNVPSLNTTEPIHDNIETLRHILSEQQQRHVGYSEAQKIGESLIEFYQVLAEEISDGLTA